MPPALVHGAEQLEGAEVLEDFGGSAGLALWQSVRDVSLWARAEPEERGELFHPGSYAERLQQLEESGLDAAVDGPLRVLARVTRDPAAMGEGELLAACQDVASWAEAQEKLGTATAFAQAGALAAPANAGAGFRVGQLARRKAEYARAESWFRRVIGLGRQAKDWASYADAFIGLGNLYRQRGNLPAARRFHIRGLRAARRHGLREIQGRALHDLFCIAASHGNTAEALDHARASFKAYGARHPRLPVLAHDLAYFWMMQGRFVQAQAVFQALLPQITAPAERMQAVADLGRAAGGAGQRRAFEDAWDEIWSFSGDWSTRPGGAQALLDLGRGAASLKDWARADRAATASRDLAARREESQVLLEAEALLDSVTRRRQLDAAVPISGDEDAEDLAADLLRTLAVGRH